MSVRELLWSLPLRDLTVARIMERTPMSRPAFYQYYDSVGDAIRVLFTEMEQVMHDRVDLWLTGQGEPIEALETSLRGVIEVCQRYGAVIRTVAEASAVDDGLELVWREFMQKWDDVVVARVEIQQAAGLIPAFEARSVVFALNRMDAAYLISEFGQRPQGDPELVLRTQYRIWASVFYGQDRLSSGL